MATVQLLSFRGDPVSDLSAARAKPLCFQELILTLHDYWAAQGCVILQPYDIEVGAGTFHPATTLRALGPKPWRAAYVQPSRRPADGRYGENPNRLQHYYQFQVILKPTPPDMQELYLGSLEAIGIDPLLHDIRFVEDDWESPTLGAWGLGWEVWCDGMEVTQFTYFQQVGGIDVRPGRRRADLRPRAAGHVRAGRRETSTTSTFNDRRACSLRRCLPARTSASTRPINFEVADTDMLFAPFRGRGDGVPPHASRRRPARCRPTTSASRPATCSICWTRAA